jgi:hypothetical protein
MTQDTRNLDISLSGFGLKAEHHTLKPAQIKLEISRLAARIDRLRVPKVSFIYRRKPPYLRIFNVSN